MASVVVRSPIRGLSVAELAQWTEAVAATSARLCDVAARTTADALRTQRRALLLRLSTRPETHFARLIGEIDGLAIPAVVRLDGRAIARRDWLEVAGLRMPGTMEWKLPGNGGPRDPLRTTLSLCRACDRVLHFELLGDGHPRLHHDPTGGLPERLLICPESFAMELVCDGPVHRIRLFGELDAATAPTAEFRLGEIAASIVEVDLAHLTFLDAGGLGALMGAKRRASEAGRVFRMVGARGIVQRVLGVAGLSDGPAG